MIPEKSALSRLLEKGEELEKRAPLNRIPVQRIDWDGGETSWEISNGGAIITFYSHNFDKPLQAKFAAEFYEHFRFVSAAHLAIIKAQALEKTPCVCADFDMDGSDGSCRRCTALKTSDALALAALEGK